MTQYILRRLVLMVPVLIAVSVLVFALARVLPGDVFVAQSTGVGLTADARDQLREEAGLNRPLAVQYLEWLGDAVRLDFGTSLYNRQSVNATLKRTIPVTLELAILATVIGLVIAIPLGVLSAAWQGSPLDYLARFFGVLGLSVPNYVIASLTITYLALWYHWTPPSGSRPLFEEPWQNFQQFVFPAVILGASFSASIMRMTRSTVLGVLREDYVRTARAKGLFPRPILITHVLRNALLPVLTLTGTQIGFLLGGSVIIENIFSLTGIGAMTFDAITNRDYVVIQAVATLAAIVFAVLNLLIDLSYAWLDPRIRLA